MHLSILLVVCTSTTIGNARRQFGGDRAALPYIDPSTHYPSCTAKSTHRNFVFFTKTQVMPVPAACQRNSGVMGPRSTIDPYYVSGTCRYNNNRNVYAVREIKSIKSQSISEWEFCSKSSGPFDVRVCVYKEHCVRLTELQEKIDGMRGKDCSTILQTIRPRDRKTTFTDATKCDFEALASAKELIHREGYSKEHSLCQIPGNQNIYFQDENSWGYCDESGNYKKYFKTETVQLGCQYRGKRVIQIVDGDNDQESGLVIYRFCTSGNKQDTEVCRFNNACVSTKEILSKLYKLRGINASAYRGCDRLLSLWQRIPGMRKEYNKLFTPKPRNSCDFSRFG